jgi:hypothetical protein
MDVMGTTLRRLEEPLLAAVQEIRRNPVEQKNAGMPFEVALLLKDLEQSANPGRRTVAAQELGKVSQSNERIVSALRNAARHDANAEVREAASQAALAPQHTATSQRQELPGFTPSTSSVNKCPRCGRATLQPRSDILPTPPGTNWAPLPRRWEECSNCGYDSRYAPKEGGDTQRGWVRGLGCIALFVAIFMLLGAFSMGSMPGGGSDNGAAITLVFALGILIFGIAAISGKIR